ncbi:MAG: DEAD/DEAH box helicase [Ruminiclostridium sp.]|nr:DEAD/DEAH box helicase [Ruminiclostridium sp.]
MFDSLGLRATLIDALKKESITDPTDVQLKAIPQAMKNRDLIVQSETGTGKTLAFLLPLFEKLDFTKKEMQAIVLAPTHELAIQIIRQIERLSENSDLKANSAPIIGNVNIDRQIEKLKEKPHIIVGSPGRILELIKKKKISAHTVKTIVIDEADRLMDENNIESVKAVIKSTLKERQLMMFSASITNDTIAKASELMKEPDIIRSSQSATVPAQIEHCYFIAEERDKIEVLRKLIRIMDPPKAIAFVSQSKEIEIMAEKLKYHGIKAEGMHGANIKSDRKKTMEDFKAGRLQLLVSSDLAARGLHIEGITHIFNLNIPENAKDYLHRAGRTGRSGSAGTAVSIVTEKEIPLIRVYEKAFKIEIAARVMYRGEIFPVKR